MLATRAKFSRKTNLPLLIRVFFLLALPLAVFSSGSAASLEGKVMEVVDGEDIVVLSQGHLVKIKLVGAASPELNQSYAGIARQHLADLVLNKYVVVRYWSLRDAYIVGQVLLQSADIGAQMIRDGVSWYNKADAASLSELEREVYQASEDTARRERRGLWQDESPVPPWDFRKAQLAPVAPATPAPAATYETGREHLPRQVSSAHRGTQAGLSSEDLMGGMVRPGSLAGKPDIKPLSSAGAPGRWLRYQPADKHFSVLVPSDGFEITYPALDGQGKMTDFHYVAGNSDKAVYFVMWTKGPNGNSTDDSAAADAIKGLLGGLNRGNERSSGLAVSATPGRSLRLTGYAGREYALEIGPVSGVIRVLSKQTGDEREVLLLCVMSAVDSEISGADFFNSFKIR
ncbi:MAG: thermonuclease family protein [Pyrinomonadaceae bacterium]